jgi:hypothetical protein
MKRRPETPAEREHRYDREVIRAVYRREKAQAGRGYKFRPPRAEVSTSTDSREGAK